jgi:hypothetical protein
MQKFWLLYSILIFGCSAVVAQPTTDSVYTYKKLNRSLSFAQLTTGGDLLVQSGGRVTFGDGDRRFGASAMPRATIGGMHFWGHADFYVTFPLGVNLGLKPGFADRLRNTESVETGMKIYPAALKPGSVRPFAGISFQPYKFFYNAKDQNNPKGPAQYSRFISPVQLGVSYWRKKYIYTLSARYNWRNQFNYYESPTVERSVQIAPLNFQFGILRCIDTDISMGSPKAVGQLNKQYHFLAERGKLNDWYLGIGPSTALQMSKSPFFKERYPYLYNDQLSSFLVPDLTVGRYFVKPDLNVGLSTRVMSFRNRAFESDLRMQRAALSFETYKFLFNYHGFVPFFGPMLSLEYLRLKEPGRSVISVTKPSLGFVFGWDIRVTQTGSGLLRTNLRYAPWLYLDANGQRIKFNHLEFNFIQFVKFLGRSKAYKSYKKQL